MRKILLSTLLVAGAVSMSACSTLRGAAIGGAGGAGVAAARAKQCDVVPSPASDGLVPGFTLHGRR